jgi:UDP-perosamine 4-acetyltransferase
MENRRAFHLMEKIILIGGGGHAGVVLEIMRQTGTYDVLGVVTRDAADSSELGLPWLGDDSVLPELLRSGVATVAMGVGGFRENGLRRRIYTMVKSLGFRVATLVHPTAIVLPSVTMGEGCVIFAGAVLNTGARLGNDVIVATRSSVDHNTIVEDHVLVSAGVAVGAQVLLGEESLIAIGACVVSRLTIGRRSVVGAGAVVIRDIPDDVIVVGNPARLLPPRT